MFKFLKKTSPEEEVRQWTRRLRAEQRQVDQQITKIRREEDKTKQAMRGAVKANDLVAARGLARALLHARRAVSRLHAAKARMASVAMRLQHDAGQRRLLGALETSGAILREMNALVRVREVHDAMRALGKEIEKAGIIDEITDDVLDLEDAEDDDAALEAEVGKVITEVTQTQIANTHVGTTKLPAPNEPASEKIAEEEEEDEELLAKLNALRTS
ncbi:unnamed protein product [Phytomonas sp. Hart1]|nr:unnamed protein product [Phytomonas sp. Hart1]|eukprot:CCW69276.1 unnamed protein product [Phytomonas sp. isolate Hart1]